MTDAISKDESQMTPAEWLDSVRQKYGLVGNLDVPDSWLEDLLGRIPEADREAARKVWLGRRSQSASQVQDELVQTYLQEVLPVLRPNERTVVETTFFGILPTYQFNAFAGFTPGGDRIVILHLALVHTLSYWSHWYLRTKDEGGRDYLRETPEQLLQALPYIVSIWLGQQPHGRLPDIYPKTADSWQLDRCLVFSAISFILGHEVGRILGGHSGYGPDCVQNHAMEFEADRGGLSIAIRHSLVKSAAIEGDTYHTKFMLFGHYLLLPSCRS